MTTPQDFEFDAAYRGEICRGSGWASVRRGASVNRSPSSPR